MKWNAGSQGSAAERRVERPGPRPAPAESASLLVKGKLTAGVPVRSHDLLGHPARDGLNVWDRLPLYARRALRDLLIPALKLLDTGEVLPCAAPEQSPYREHEDSDADESYEHDALVNDAGSKHSQPPS